MSAQGPLRKDLTPEEFQLFRDWIHEHSGIFLEPVKMDSLRISLVTRATRHNFNEYRDYFRVLSSDEDEFKELMNLVTINETSFFRFPAQFDAFRDKVVPELLGKKAVGDSRFRVWSAGCSTGEEPYTIAMTLLDSMAAQHGYSLEVVGTDVSTQALDRARTAVYPDRSLTSLSPEAVRRWFESVPGGHRPVSQVRDLCHFHYHNLIKEQYLPAVMTGWDVVFCRNVTIYFRIESTKRVVDRFYEALNPGGYLFIGHSETLSSVSDRFEAVEIGGVFLYRKPELSQPMATVPLKHARKPAIEQKPRGAVERVRRAVGRRSGSADLPAHGAAPVPPAGLGAGELVAAAHGMLDQARAADALEAALKALEIEPMNLDAHVVAAFSYADIGDLEAAKEQAQEALHMNPLAAPAHYILGVIRREQGDPEGAVSEFKRTIYIDAEFVLAHFALANIRKQRGDLVSAKRDYENALVALKRNPEGEWTQFLGGFRTDLLARTCELGLVECGKRRARD
jgi:chemotaxis protein methyltransferase CheR